METSARPLSIPGIVGAFRGQQMQEAQETLLRDAGVVIYVAPTILDMVDARLLASTVDQLRESNPRVVGVALTGVGENPF